jgi:hypothetical protein
MYISSGFFLPIRFFLFALLIGVYISFKARFGTAKGGSINEVTIVTAYTLLDIHLDSSTVTTPDPS